LREDVQWIIPYNKALAADEKDRAAEARCCANNMNMHLPRFPEENLLIDFVDEDRSFKLHPETLDAWKKMKVAAESNGINLHIISAFRSVARQSEIIEEKKRKKIPDAMIFSVSAPPGYSEHHTGRAVDLGTQNYTDLEEEFENSEAFRWLIAHARQVGFRLSYPRENPYGIGYEPWHWFYEGNAQPESGADGV